MSEKRQRQQQRRHRRKTQSRPRAASPDRHLVDLTRRTVNGIVHVTDGFEAELWASDLMGTFRTAVLIDEPDGLLPKFVRAAERLGTPNALAALRALSALGATGTEPAADRLAAAGVSDPAWRDDLGRAQPVAALLLEEPAFDDGVSVLVEFIEPSGESYTINVYIDHNLGGLAKDATLGGRLTELRELLRTAPDGDLIAVRDLELAEARARIEAALFMLDHTLDPQVGEDVHALRGLIEARTRLLPDGCEIPDPYTEIPRTERDALLADFLSSPEGEPWRGDEDAEFAVQLAIDFGADYNHGGPLRWSPVVVEIFMLDWLARKVTEEPAFFEHVPDVLPSWVSYAGRRRGIPAPLLQEALAAVAEYRTEMLEAVTDPEAWGPAKIFMTAATEAGVDLSDRAAVDRFIEEYNERLAT